MTDKDQQVHSSKSNGQTKHDEETVIRRPSKDAHKKKRMKCLLYIVLFAVFQTGIILLFVLTIMKIRTPKFRVRSATFDTFDYSSTTNPSFNMRMNAELGVKNANFGRYKFRDSMIYFSYNDLIVGEAFIPKARAKARSTKKFNVIVNLSSSNFQNHPQLGNDLNSGVSLYMPTCFMAVNK
ncbi:Late embryogenesis abundant (LEA) hydroxyproline-rich glycoprotein family [Forsythia ovata]|uniref:Late embryogenesis abundant (LEA) hydroxyproline-rich glycoprotein family n=1 Tax=Forsythia ovata TaxID=205694 RepID=A0ABD1X2I4_9LAMI